MNCMHACESAVHSHNCWRQIFTLIWESLHPHYVFNYWYKIPYHLYWIYVIVLCRDIKICCSLLYDCLEKHLCVLPSYFGIWVQPNVWIMQLSFCIAKCHTYWNLVGEVGGSKVFALLFISCSWMHWSRPSKGHNRESLSHLINPATDEELTKHAALYNSC